MRLTLLFLFGLAPLLALGQSSSVCGDQTLQPEEACDDGNALSGDGCSYDCLKIERCGDGFLDQGEACDDGNQSSADACTPDCKSLLPGLEAAARRAKRTAIAWTLGGYTLTAAGATMISIGATIPNLDFTVEDGLFIGGGWSLALGIPVALAGPSFGKRYAGESGAVLKGFFLRSLPAGALAIGISCAIGCFDPAARLMLSPALMVAGGVPLYYLSKRDIVDSSGALVRSLQEGRARKKRGWTQTASLVPGFPSGVGASLVVSLP